MSDHEASRHSEWWQHCEIDVFKEKIKTLSLEELLTMKADICGALAVMQGQIQSRDPAASDIDWVRRIRAALGFIAQKKQVLLGELSRRRRDVDKLPADSFRALILAARENLDKGNLPEALRATLDVLELAFKRHLN